MDPPIDLQDWWQAYNKVLTQMDGNVDSFITMARELGYYPDLDPPQFNQHGGLVQSGFELSLRADQGPIYYTLDASDPRHPPNWPAGARRPAL